MEVNDVGPTAAVGGVSDRELWARAANGDRDAFGRIFDRHAKTVYNHLFRRTADWSEAEDLTSAVFLHAWRRRSEVALDRDSALPWLLGIAERLLSNT
ncbi:sigma factor, partial [Streptomyces sp. SID6137]|uniref:sigma factor n=2 Tax=Actinomycetota TaxID=201174 RepID=UPI00137E0E22|nr:siderophore-interacting protein [Streptomyces sp. SID6137]